MTANTLKIKCRNLKNKIARTGKGMYNKDQEQAMAKVKEMTMEELEQFIENKLIEIIGDPDSGLELKPAFKKKLAQRLKKPSKRISHQEVLKRLG